MFISCTEKMKLVHILGTLVILVGLTTGTTIPKAESKIINGTNAKAGDFPFVTSVHNSTTFLCTGVLIDVFWVLTSAICVSADQFNPLKVSVGGVHYSGTELGRYDINVASVFIHEDFYSCNAYLNELLNDESDSYYYCNNMALLRLSSPAIPNVIIQPIALTNPTEVFPPGTRAQVVGWGGSTNGNPAPTLQYSDNFEIMDTDDCSNAILINMTNLDTCTVKTSQATCLYDQGGPLFKLDSARGFVLVGIVNYTPCGKNLPNVYASASGQRWWIAKIAGL